MKEITSRENSLIKSICELQRSAKMRRHSDCFILEGLRICMDAFDNGIVFDKLIISKTSLEKHPQEIERFTENSADVVLVPDSLFEKISDTDSPQGILVVAARPKNDLEVKQGGKYIAAENIGDPTNLGAISRTCEALGADGLLLSKGCCDPYSPKSLRASMGTLLRIPVIVLEDFINDIKSSGLKTYGCVVDKTALPISEVKFADGSAVLIGNEANGLTKETKQLCDTLVTIPMKGKAESLNAAAAASIAIWEMMK